MEKKIPLFSPEFQAMVVKDFVGDDHGAETLLTDLEENVLPAYVEWCRDKPDAHWRTLAEKRATSLARVCLDRIEFYLPLARKAVRSGDASRSTALALDIARLWSLLDRAMMRALSEDAFDATRGFRRAQKKGGLSQQAKGEGRARAWDKLATLWNASRTDLE